MNAKEMGIALVLTSVTCAACAGGRKSISERPLGSVPKTKNSGEGESRVVPVPSLPPDIYARRKSIEIKPATNISETGSLTKIDDPRNYLIGLDMPIELGSFLDIKVASNKGEPSKSGGAVADASKPADGGKTQDQANPDNKKPDQMEQELLKALPGLEPGSKDHPPLLKEFKMEVLRKYDNGDVLVMYKRRSVRGDQAGEIVVKARVPVAALQRHDQLSTSDLADVDWRESFEGEIGERRSSNWEDEYTLRMSGFDEARSKSAVALEDQRRQLKEVRDKLGTQIKTFAQERQTVAKERAELLEQKKKNQEKFAELEKKVKDQESEIESLKPKEEEPADAPVADKKVTDSAGAGKPGAKATAPKSPTASSKTTSPTKPTATAAPTANAKTPNKAGG